MPSLSVHTLVGLKLGIQEDISFFIGNIAPDSIEEREMKDQTHLRTSDNRFDDLRCLAKKLDISNPFTLGVIAHLFTDLFWDQEMITKYQKDYKGKNWFVDYRKEIAILSGHLFKTDNKIQNVFKRMSMEMIDVPKDIKWIKKDAVAAQISRNYRWHMDNSFAASEYFTDETVMNFVDSVVEKFNTFIKEVS